MRRLSYSLPLKIVSESNSTEYWRVKHARHKTQKFAVKISMLSARIPQELPVIVTMTRLARGKLDSDNLQGAFKWIRDQIADHFIPGLKPGRADSDPRITWEYDQLNAKDYGCILTFAWPHLEPLEPQESKRCTLPS